ncbi:MAG: DDE-type integrase/transposase/recombinase [Candidatus Omnitrophica bacterium]|nr:DDE-type integrase/transposase/recombinase [Candidatus Omnitrophota bacterium]
MMNEKKREEIALFRYSLIVPFLSQEELEWGVKGELLKRMISEIHTIPFSKKRSLAESTLRRYLRMYRLKGFDGLKPKSRSDVKKSHKISSDILEKAFLLKKEEPKRSARKIIQIMEAHQMAPLGLLKPSTLSRIFKQHGLTRKQLAQSQKSFRSFQADHANQIWQSDIMYGPYLPDPDRPQAKKRTYLMAILDDYSRLIPHAEFYWHERLPHLENTLHKALLKRGIPDVFYVDNGQVFSAHQINAICAELGIRKISCKPYSPEGKGKIERFFHTVRSSFITELTHEKVDHLHQLNNKFWAWLEQEYHLQVHSTTQQQPNNRWRQNVTSFMRKIEEQQLQTIFLWREKRKVNKLGLVSLAGQQFEVASMLVGKAVEVRYNHFDLTEVFIYLDGRFIQKAKPTKISRWNTAKKQNAPTAPPEKRPQSNVCHLQYLEKQHQQNKIQQAKQLTGKTYQKPPQKILFTKARFFKEIATSLKRNLENFHAKELDQMQTTWDKFRPLDPALVHIALAKAIMDKKTEQHISFYLEYIIKIHINHQSEQTNDK